MKTTLTRFLHLFMAIVVLLSSMGFGLVDHTCQMRGKRTYLIHQHNKACKVCPATATEQATGPVIKRTACCVERARFEKVETGSSFSHALVKFVKAIAEAFGAPVAALFTSLFGLFVFPAEALSAVADPPAPPYGRELLVLVQVFLI